MKKIVLTVMAIVAVTSVSASAGLLAHYSFDSDFADSSANGNDLTGSGGITSTAVFGSALDLQKSSGQFLSLTSAINFGTSDSWSVSFWAKKRNPNGSDPTGMVLGDNTSTDSFIWLPDNSRVVRGMRFRPVGVGTSFSADFATGHDTDFHHWVVIADASGSISVYRDNTPLGSKPVDGGTDFNILTVGSGYTGTNQLFDGQIDELYIFNEAIDSATVTSLYTSNVVPEPATLVLLALGGLSIMRRRRG